jgi:hypothetical protein
MRLFWNCFRVFDSCVIWPVAFLCAWLVLVVIAFLVAWTLMSPIWDFNFLMDSLTPFLVGWDEFVDIFLELLCWSTTLPLWCFFWFFLCWSLESLSPFCSNNHTRSFLQAYISRHAFYGDSTASFMNQILYLANPHDKLSALCVSKSWVPRYLLTNLLGSKTWISLSCHM